MVVLIINILSNRTIARLLFNVKMKVTSLIGEMNNVNHKVVCKS